MRPEEIVSQFINIQAALISEATVIDKSVVKGSIMIHRMYAMLAKEGFKVASYSSIRTFGDLLKFLNGSAQSNLFPTAGNSVPASTAQPLVPENGISKNFSGVGIDIESVENFPEAQDFRTDSFYVDNFTGSEISYCILKANPIEAFAGLFCAKEAAFKANPAALDNLKFNQIEISHSKAGKPFLNGFYLSISHAKGTAVAVAVAIN
jgi:phosphopantetheine--protein transferase-like protein